MFRGNIDFASWSRIEGWVYCERLSLVGAQVHAFVGDECVGSGVADLFRQDLVEAGVGDGFGGFNFAISLDKSQDPRTLHIRVEDGNAIIRQPGARLAPAVGNLAQNTFAGNPQPLYWMLGRGWLSKGQFRILNALSVFGVVKQRLVEPLSESLDQESDQQLLRNTTAILELLALTALTASLHADFAPADFARQRERLHAEFPTSPPVIAIAAQRENSINVAEGSHILPGGAQEAAGGGADYEFGPNLLLWVNLDCKIRFPTGGLVSAVAAFVPNRKGEH
jgi:hypothetical protein